MPETTKYNPFARNFYRIRRVLNETLDVPRHAVRPSAKLAELIPHEQRQFLLGRWRRRIGQEHAGPNPHANSRRVSGVILVVSNAPELPQLLALRYRCNAARNTNRLNTAITTAQPSA
jgi:hypothetical protein